MKKLSILFFSISCCFASLAQDTAKTFPAEAFRGQLQKIVCAGKSDFADLIGKAVVRDNDTTWKTNFRLPGFSSANFAKDNSMIDFAFIAYEPFQSPAQALNYYGQAMQAIDANLESDCLKMERARIPVEVQGVQKYDLWKSKDKLAYRDLPNTFLYISLNLDSENEVVMNVFLKRGVEPIRK